MVTAVRSFNCRIETASALPAWLASAPLFKWGDIPNSILGVGDGTTGIGLSSAFLAGRHFARSGSTVTWGLNKFGIQTGGPTFPNSSWGGIRYLYGNTPWDRVRGRMMFGNGDTNWPENGVHACEINHPEGARWVAEVVRSSDQQDIKWNNQGVLDFAFDAVGHLNADGTTNDPRWARHYDGRPKTGHLSWHCQYNSVRDWFLSVGRGQLYPHDSGAFTDVLIGDLNTGDWLDRDFQGYDASGDPLGETIPRIPTAASEYGSGTGIIASGNAAGQRVANGHMNPCCISNDAGDIFRVTNTGPNVHRLTNSLIGTVTNPWVPLSPGWYTFAGVTAMKQQLAGGSYRNMALSWNSTSNYLLMMGYSRETSGFAAGIYDFNTPVTISGVPYPCTFKTFDEAGSMFTSFTGAQASAVTGFNNFTTNNEQTLDWPVWNTDLGAFLWFESATGKVIQMQPAGSTMVCTYLPMTAGAADPPAFWAGTEYRRLGWDYIPFLHTQVFRGPYNAPIKYFRTA